MSNNYCKTLTLLWSFFKFARVAHVVGVFCLAATLLEQPLPVSCTGKSSVCIVANFRAGPILSSGAPKKFMLKFDLNCVRLWA